MLKKSHIIICVAILSLFGLIRQKQITLPNQELLLRFNNTNITSVGAKRTIASVKAQLKRIGVKQLNVQPLKNGTLKITYHSHTRVETIKRILQDAENLLVDNKNETPIPSPSKEDTALSYNFDIYEIQTETHFNKALNSTQRITFHVKSNRFLEPNPYFLTKILASQLECVSIKLVHTTPHHLAIAIHYISKSIPEVRAGPLS